MSVHNPTIETQDVKETPSGAIDGSNKVFTTSQDFLTGSLQLFLNGQLQEEGAGNDYQETDTNEITMEDAPKTSVGNPDKLFVVYTPA